MDSNILIFDEPFASLDFPGVKNVLSQIVTLHKKGHTVIVITHDLGKVLAHGERLIIMKKGKIAHSGMSSDLLEQLEPCQIKRPDADSIAKMTWLR